MNHFCASKVDYPDPDSFRPQKQRKRAQNPGQMRPQSLMQNEAGLTKSTAAHPSGGPVQGGDWYVWHAPDGLRARAATGLGCMQAGAKKLVVIEASYASGNGKRHPLSVTVMATNPLAPGKCGWPQLPYEGVEMVMPGDHTPLQVNLDKPIALEAGSRFAIREGGKTVGSGVVTEVIE